MSLPTIRKSSEVVGVRIGRRVLIGAAAGAIGTVVGIRPAFALSLDEALAAGLVGEMPNGYVGIVRDGGGVRALVDRVNAQRRQEYQRVAASAGAPLAAVEQRAGQQLIARLPAGHHYMTPAGAWARK